MKRITIVLFMLAFVASWQQAFSQGCVAIKGTAVVCCRPTDYSGWDLNFNRRYCKSFKYFVDKVEQQGVDFDSNVIKHSFQGDAAFADYLINLGVSFRL